MRQGHVTQLYFHKLVLCIHFQSTCGLMQNKKWFSIGSWSWRDGSRIYIVLLLDSPLVMLLTTVQGRSEWPATSVPGESVLWPFWALSHTYTWTHNIYTNTHIWLKLSSVFNTVTCVNVSMLPCVESLHPPIFHLLRKIVIKTTIWTDSCS